MESIHNLSLWQIGLAAALIVVNGAISAFLRLGLERRLLEAAIRTVAQLLLLWLRGRAIGARRLIQIGPFLALGLAMGLVAIFWERFQIGTVGDRFSLDPLEALLVASRALWFYLGKLAWPAGLAFSYPRFEVDPHDPLDYVWLVAGGVAAGAAEKPNVVLVMADDQG